MARPRLVCLALALLTLLLYLPVRQHGFLLYDDPEYITENPVVRAGLTPGGARWAFTTFHAGNWHPLTWLSHMLDCELFGLDSGAHHLANVLWHVTNALLLFALMLRITGKLWPAALVAALFAWHPLHVQSVAWAAERKDLVSTCFGLFSILAYVKWTSGRGQANGSGETDRKPGRTRFYWLAVLCFALALLAKPMLVTLPFLLLLLDFWPLRRLPGISPAPAHLTTGGSRPAQVSVAAALLEKGPFFLLTLLSCVVTYRAQHSGEAVVALAGHPFGARLANAAASYAGYLGKMVWPEDLAIIYPLETFPALPLVVAGGLMLTGFSYLAWRLRTGRPHWLVGWLWYVGMLVPVIGLVQVGGQAMADRYTYLPLVGIFLVFAVEADLLVALGHARLVAAVCVVISLAAAGATRWQLQFWRDSEALFARALAVTRDNAVAHANYGMALEQSGRRELAREHHAAAVRLNPNLAQAHNNLANLLDAPGQRELALEHYREALRLKPRAALTHANLASLLISMGRASEAQPHYAEASRLSPGDARPQYVVAKAYVKAGQPREGIRLLEEALRRDPDHLPSLAGLARLLATAPDPGLRDGARAVQLALRAAELTGREHPIVMDTLAAAYAEGGRFAEAAETMRRALAAAEGGEPSLLEGMRRRMALYEAKQPWREAVESALR